MKIKNLITTLAIFSMLLNPLFVGAKTIKNAPDGKRTSAQLEGTMGFPLDTGTNDYWTDLAEHYLWIKAQTDVLYASKPWYDGSAISGSVIKFYGPSVANGGHGTYTSIQGADYVGDEGTGIQWRLPITYPASGQTALINTDSNGNLGLVAPSTFAAASHNHAGSAITSGTVGASYLPAVSGSSAGIVPTTNTITDGWVLTKQADGTSAWAAPTGSGYTNLTSFVAQTAWRLFYSDGSGDVQELALGSDGEYLKSNGASSAPSWATPSGAAHDAITLSTDLGNNLLGLSTQQITLDSQNANIVFAGPSTGSAAAPSFRSLVAADIPSLTATYAAVTGTSSSTFQVGTDGPKIKNNSGTIEARNAADDAYANVKGKDAYYANYYSTASDGNYYLNINNTTAGGGHKDSPAEGDFDSVDAIMYIYRTSWRTIVDSGQLGALSTGLLKNTTTTGALSIAVAGTDYQAPLTMAAASDINTGTDTAKPLTSDALAGSNLGIKEIGWTIKDSDGATAVADGKQAFVVPAAWNGMNLVDLTCAVADLNSAASGATTVVLRRVRGATAVDMTSTGVTINYDEYSASDETVDTSNDDIATGDKIYVDVNAITTAAHKGLSCTASFQLP